MIYIYGGRVFGIQLLSLYIILAGTEMSQLICGGCRTLLMYTRGATSVRCSCCHTVNLATGTILMLESCALHYKDSPSYFPAVLR